MEASKQNYYQSKKKKLMKQFNKAINTLRPIFTEKYGETMTATLIEEIRNEYSNIIPRLPYVGGKQTFTQFIISTGWYLALYRILKKRGITINEIGKLIDQLVEKYLATYPKLLIKMFSRGFFSKRRMKEIQKGAEKSLLRSNPDSYVFHYIPGDGKEFTFGVDYLECGSLKFLRKEGAEELAPIVCRADIFYSKILGWGLKRTKTLAEDFDVCDFRFRKGAKTDIVNRQLDE